MKQIHWFEAKETRFERDALGGINKGDLNERDVTDKSKIILLAAKLNKAG